MYRKLKSRWTMEKTGESFTDMVSWRDCYGDEYMAERKWGFRVKV